jgi:1,2-diacylglycerol-3-alpha-glucose alpha-1,2-galactosyltransferase
MKIKPTLTVMSLAEKVKGQGVGSAFHEQYSLITERMSHQLDIRLNTLTAGEVTHYHTINFRFFIHALLNRHKTLRIASVHFLPETIEGSIELPKIAKVVFYRYLLAFYKSMDYLVTVNPVFIDKLETLGLERSSIAYIPNYVSKDQFYKMQSTEKSEIRKRYDYSSRDFIVLGVGQIQTRKGILDFIETAKKTPHIQFVWAGGFSFGKITDGYEILKDVVENPPSNVRFLGILEREEMNGVYNMVDMLFLPSYSELFPMTVLEAMSVEIPILLRKLPLYEDILFDYYLSSENNDQFSQIISRLSKNDPYYQAWADQSKKGAEFYDRESVGQLWENYYKSMLDLESRAQYDKKTKAFN